MDVFSTKVAILTRQGLDLQLTGTEFRRFVHETEALLRGLFDNIDRDNSGNVDKAELKSAFSRAGIAVADERLERFFNDVDKNDDGVISFGEWR